MVTTVMDRTAALIRGRVSAYATLDSPYVLQRLRERGNQIAAVLGEGGIVYFAGNGGSAALCQHVAAEYMVRYAITRVPGRAVSLTTDTSVLTAIGNDFSFDEIFERQVEALCTEDDLLVLHSTSGRSTNIVRAAIMAEQKGCPVLTVLGGHFDGGEVAALEWPSHLIVPVAETALVQELSLTIEHLTCEYVERTLWRSTE